MNNSELKAAKATHRTFVREHKDALVAALDKNQTVVAIARALTKAEIPVDAELLREALTAEIGPVA